MTDSGNLRLFVYGSLRSGFRNPMFEYISRFFTFAGMGKVKGILYDMEHYLAGVPTIDEKFIIGELYNAKEEAEFFYAIGQLDDYEGVLGEAGDPPLFRREIVNVILDDREVQSWIYWFNDEPHDRPLVASGDIFEFLKNKQG
jgi:gamma-glutamylcyclotransferase (GGCT)/AIG2-like uncharacterized protein YtfP